MNKNIRRLLGGMSTASLVIAGSIPLMSQTGGGSTGGKQPQAAKDAPKSTMQDTKGKGECRTDGKPGMAQPNVKDTKGKGGCGSTKTPETKAKSK
jgi:hypothetical protein